jgi:hypothetical protein
MRFFSTIMLMTVCAPLFAASNQPVGSLPAFELPDPTGAKHTQADILQLGAVVIVTIPTSNTRHFKTAGRE